MIRLIRIFLVLTVLLGVVTLTVAKCQSQESVHDDEVHLVAPLRSASEIALEPARKALASKDHASQAFGAYLVGDCQVEQLVPKVRELLESQVAAAKPDATLICSLADALICQRATTNGKSIEWLKDNGYPEMALKLIESDSKSYLGMLKDIACQESGLGSIVAYNLMLRHHPAECARWLLESTHFEINILAVTKGSAGRRVFAKDKVTSRKIVRQAGWPPVVLYTFDSSPHGDFDVLFADGPKPVYLRRVEYKDDSDFDPEQAFIDFARYRAECFRELAQLKLDTFLASTSTNTTILFKDDSSFKEDVKERCRKAQQTWSALIDGLKSRGLIMKDEGLPKFDIKITDMRDSENSPIPTIQDIFRE